MPSRDRRVRTGGTQHSAIAAAPWRAVAMRAFVKIPNLEQKKPFSFLDEQNRGFANVPSALVFVKEHF